jgi:hypothetical protein
VATGSRPQRRWRWRLPRGSGARRSPAQGAPGSRRRSRWSSWAPPPGGDRRSSRPPRRAGSRGVWSRRGSTRRRPADGSAGSGSPVTSSGSSAWRRWSASAGPGSRWPTSPLASGGWRSTTRGCARAGRCSGPTRACTDRCSRSRCGSCAAAGSGCASPPGRWAWSARGGRWPGSTPVAPAALGSRESRGRSRPAMPRSDPCRRPRPRGRRRPARRCRSCSGRRSSRSSSRSPWRRWAAR